MGVVVDGRAYGGDDLLDTLEGDELRAIAKGLRTHLHREREYIKKLEHDHGLMRDALDAIQYQRQLSLTTARRITRLAVAGLQVGPYWPGQKFIHPDQPTREILESTS